METQRYLRTCIPKQKYYPAARNDDSDGLSLAVPAWSADSILPDEMIQPHRGSAASLGKRSRLDRVIFQLE